MTTKREADFVAAAYASGITSAKELVNLMGQPVRPPARMSTTPLTSGWRRRRAPPRRGLSTTMAVN